MCYKATLVFYQHSKEDKIMEWQVGEFTIKLAIYDRFRLDGGIIWNGVPKETWKHWCKDSPFRLDRKNRVQLSVNCFLVTTPTAHRVLIDTSFGKPSQWPHHTATGFAMENVFNLFEKGEVGGADY